MSKISYIVNDSLNVKGKGDYNFYHKDRPITGGGVFHEFRKTGTRTVIIPQTLNVEGSFIGVFDQSIMIESSYDVPFKIELFVNYFDDVSKIHRYAFKILSEDISRGSKRVSLLPETSDNLTILPTQPVFVVPELRAPVSSFTLTFTFETAPTAGELKIAIARRF